MHLTLLAIILVHVCIKLIFVTASYKKELEMRGMQSPTVAIATF